MPDTDPTSSTAFAFPTNDELASAAERISKEVQTFVEKSAEEVRAHPWRYAIYAGATVAAIAAVCGGVWYKKR